MPFKGNKRNNKNSAKDVKEQGSMNIETNLDFNSDFEDSDFESTLSRPSAYKNYASSEKIDSDFKLSSSVDHMLEDFQTLTNFTSSSGKYMETMNPDDL